jgi:drug/metabolite transporter (DMT)-like permease
MSSCKDIRILFHFCLLTPIKHFTHNEYMAIQKHEPLSTAKALVGFLCFTIVFVLFWKFQENQAFFFEDPNALRNYVVAAIIGGGLLIVLFYHASQTTHPKSTTKSSRKKKN